ncbi:unnamed protein product [Rotaria socialis]
MPEYEDAANQRQDDDGDDDGDDDDDNNSQCSNLDQSLSANCITNRFNMMNFNDRAEQSIEVSLCSDSEASLSKALSFKIESWTLTEDELTFILKQQQRGRPMQNNMPIRERCIQINVYLHHLAQNPFLHIYIYYTRVKQFFADFPKSHLRKVILLDNDDAACNSFAREVGKDHTNTAAGNDEDITKYDLPPLTAKWCWQDDDGEKISDDSQTRQIEAAFQHCLQTSIPSTLKINPDNLTSATIVCYSIHFHPNLRQLWIADPNVLNGRFVCGYQMRESTAYKRYIIRYPLVSPVHNTSDGYRPKPLDTYHLKMQSKEEDWNIISINNTAVKQAEIAIRKAIVSATISEPFSVNLKEDIDAHKTAITTIAIQQFIHVDFQQDSTGNLSLILKGFQQNILQAKLQISLYVQDILRMEADKDDELDIPRQWGDQEEQLKLVELLKNDADFIRIEKRMRETKLWNHYALRRRILQQELSNKPNLQIEMELFHGTRAAPPKEIYNGEYGFDMTFCTSGLWGLGTYFAMNASYSCQSYSYQLPNGKRQVFLAQVLTGDVFDYKGKNDQTLRRPPKKNESISDIRYNSVAGETGGSKVYIVYENRVAYPTFLITYSQ